MIMRSLNVCSKLFRVDYVRLGEHSFATEIDCRVDVNTQNKICADPPLDIKVEKILIHPRYHKTAMQITNDIALLRLKDTVHFTREILNYILFLLLYLIKLWNPKVF